MVFAIYAEIKPVLFEVNTHFSLFQPAASIRFNIHKLIMDVEISALIDHFNTVYSIKDKLMFVFKRKSCDFSVLV